MRSADPRLLRACVALAFVSVSAPAAGHPRESTPGVPAGEKGTRGGVVAVSHPLAAEAGARMLGDGGNAIDAAVAIQAALNVVEPQSSGIGGGGFMMIHLARSGRTVIVDSREEAPAAATPDMFAPSGTALGFEEASTSGLAVGVPGTLAGMALALERWGTMSLCEVLAPAIDLAENGFAINEVLAADIVDAEERGVVMTTLQPETAALFQPGGAPLRAGDVLVQPDLARTFKLIAREGPRVFYEGEIARAIVEAQQRTRAGPAGVGRMTLEDLASYRPKLRKPMVGKYRGVKFVGMPPPSSGGLTILQMLEMLEEFPLGDESAGFGFGAKITLHVMIEAMRLAFADRAVWMGDADFVDVPVTGLLAPPYVASRGAMIDPAARIPTVTAGNPLPFDEPAGGAAAPRAPAEQEEGVHTTHFSVVDRWGNVVSWTTTIESTFGTGILVPGYGFLLNNELTDFNFVPALDPAAGNPGANDVASGKRPRSSMSPTLLFRRGEPFAAYGSPGGSTIINTVLQITLNLVDHGMTIQEAIDAPRISVNNAAGRGICEAGPLDPRGFTPTPAFSPAVLDALRAMGHELPACTTSPIGSVQAVVIDLRTGKRYGGADERREGTVVTVRGGGHPQHGDRGRGRRRDAHGERGR
jgi:gamma-glutamyltranspeptidase/glutathione hydrolase